MLTIFIFPFKDSWVTFNPDKGKRHFGSLILINITLMESKVHLMTIKLLGKYEDPFLTLLSFHKRVKLKHILKIELNLSM